MLDDAGLTYDRDYTRCAYVHDEQQFSVIPAESEHLAKLIEESAIKAGEYYNFRVPITASADTVTWAVHTDISTMQTLEVKTGYIYFIKSNLLGGYKRHYYQSRQ